MTVTMLGLAVATRALLRRLRSPSMPTRRNLEAHPNQYLAPGGTWPDGPLQEPVKPEAEFVMKIARRLRDHCKNQSRRSVARQAGIDTQTVINILNGDTWCDVPTIYRLESALQTHLWSRRHVESSPWARPEPSDA